MDSAADRRPQLPALSYLDVDKAQRNDDESSHPRKPDSAVGRRETSSSSPTAQHPLAPPPSSSRSQREDGWSGHGSRPRTPPESRSARESDMENLKQVMRQSLPSITEALKMEAEQGYGHGSASRQHQPAAASIPRSREDASRSPQSSTRRPLGMEPPQSQSPYASVKGRPTPQSRDSYGTPSYVHSESRTTGYHSAPDARSSTSSQTSSNHHHPVQYPPSRPTSQYDQSQSSQHSGGAPPPPHNVPYGYTSYSPRHPQPAAPPSSAAGPVYQPSRDYDAPRTSSHSGWKPDSVSRYNDDRGGPSYGDSVKRHLEMYDLEAALNEVSSTSRIVQDFSRRYGEHMHQTSRTGPDLSTLPSLVEVDDMIHKSRTQHDALVKIRDVVVTQKVAYEQQVADQRAASSQQTKAFATDAADPRHSAPLSRQAPLDMPPPGHDGEGGFAGGENKKLRRGRAAPPGRCHSCNRAETPEWRRGPDGARTLCNACGLHYAKLTRKQSNANKTAHAGSSNLRPKE